MPRDNQDLPRGTTKDLVSCAFKEFLGPHVVLASPILWKTSRRLQEYVTDRPKTEMARTGAIAGGALYALELYLAYQTIKHTLS